MNQYELDYKEIVKYVLQRGERKQGRNGITKSVFGITLGITLNEGFPLLTSRKIFYKGVFGELAAMLRGPKTVADFENQGCNYWKLWADLDGNLELDYGNAWLDFNGVNQLQYVIDTLKTNPNDRRMVISGWRPHRLDKLSLPCCHYAYQFYVREGRYLDMLWTQRSADLMVGVPSDVVFGAAWIIMLANEVGYKPGRLILSLGDVHIYDEHTILANEYVQKSVYGLPAYYINKPEGAKLVDFTAQDITVIGYQHKDTMFFELKA